MLVAAEAGTALLARRDGWWPEKAEAWRTVARERGRIRAWRRFVQAQRTVGDGPVLSLMTASVTTPAVEAPFTGAIERLLELYRRAVVAALGA